MFGTSSDTGNLERRIRRMELLLDLIATRLEISPEEIAEATRTRVSDQVARLAAEGKKIQAIKVLREEQDLDLATAKRIVDEL